MENTESEFADNKKKKKWAFAIKNIPIKKAYIKREMMHRINLKFCECIFHVSSSFDSSATTDFI